MSSLILKYPEYHWDLSIIDIEGYESFDYAPTIQYCDKIRLVYKLPYSKMYFPKNRAILALRFLEFKIDPGLGHLDVKTYINNIPFNCWCINENLNNYFDHIQAENVITIQHLNSINYDYSIQIYTYIVRFPGDDKYKNSELYRWV